MMLETFGDIVNEALSYGFNDGPQVNRKRMENWVNEGLFQIAREIEATEWQATHAYTLEQGVYKYTLPEGFLRVQDIYYPELQRRLRPVDLQQFDTTAPKEVEGPPSIYTIYANELWLFPSPNATGEELELRFIKAPTVLSAPADVPGLQANYLFLLVDYAVARAFEAEDDYEAANARMARYKAGLQAFGSDMQFQIVDRPRLVDGTWSSGAYAGRI